MIRAVNGVVQDGKWRCADLQTPKVLIVVLSH